MKKFFSLLLIGVLIGSVCSSAVVAESQLLFTAEWCYTVENGKAAILNYIAEPTSATLVVPEAVDGYSVTSIEFGNFEVNETVKVIKIPKTIAVISGPINYGNRVLEQIVVDEANANYCSVDGVLYNKQRTILHQVPSGRIGTFTVADGVEQIGDWAFYCCSGLKKIVLPDSVISIGELAFSFCTNLQSIDLPDGIISIGKKAFYGAAVTEMVLPPQVTVIENGTFENCLALSAIVIPEGVTTIGEMAFYNCPNLYSVTLPNTVKQIGDYALGQVDYSTYDCIVWAPLKGFTIYGYAQTAAHTFAQNNGFAFVDLNGVSDQMGDVYANGTRDALDALLVLKYAVGKCSLHESQIAVGDMDQNGRLDAADALEILKVAVA